MMISYKSHKEYYIACLKSLQDSLEDLVSRLREKIHCEWIEGVMIDEPNGWRTGMLRRGNACSYLLQDGVKRFRALAYFWRHLIGERTEI